MSAGFPALRDDDLRAGVACLGRFGGSPDLIGHADPRVAQACDDLPVDVPEEAHDGDTGLDDHIELAGQQIGRRCGRDDVDAEMCDAAAAHGRDLAVDEGGGLAHHTEKSEPARGTDGRHQFRTRNAAHSCKHHGKPAPQKVE